MLSTRSPRLRPLHGATLLLFALLLPLAVATPATADWLVTTDGERIETQGAWEVKARAVVYTDSRGERQQLPLVTIDVDASRNLTRGATAGTTSEEPPVILYTTSWCPWCRKARQLLKDLDVDYVEKDIEKEPAAGREMRQKVGGRTGVPVIDFDGQVVRGFDERRIRRHAPRFPKQPER